MIIAPNFRHTTIQAATQGELILLELGGGSAKGIRAEARDGNSIHTTILECTALELRGLPPIWNIADLDKPCLAPGIDWVLELDMAPEWKASHTTAGTIAADSFCTSLRVAAADLTG